MKTISLTNLIAKVNSAYKLNLDAPKMRSIITDCKIAGIKEKLIGKEIGEAVDLIVQQAKRNETKRYNPLIASVQKIKADTLENCPMCNQKMEMVTLAGKRKAVYCTTHKICLPLPA